VAPLELTAEAETPEIAGAAGGDQGETAGTPTACEPISAMLAKSLSEPTAACSARKA